MKMLITLPPVLLSVLPAFLPLEPLLFPLHSPYQAMEMLSPSLELDWSVNWTTTLTVRGHTLIDLLLKIRLGLEWKIWQLHQSYSWLYSSWRCVQSRNNTEGLRPIADLQWVDKLTDTLYSTITLQSSSNYSESQFKRWLHKQVILIRVPNKLCVSALKEVWQSINYL